ncbi:MAG: hemolysin III family protein [Rhizobiales bacterium]|nr:hemolysin III family protein [Hyphomicrobiales bacterium]
MVANPIPNQRPYDRTELLADAIVHGGALAAALFGGGYMLAQSLVHDGAKIAALVVYVLSLVAMLGFSAAYNLTPASPVKWILRRFDHSAIYLMIAGTYTPVLLQLPHGLSLLLACVVWGGALAGIALKVFLPGRFDMLAIVIYLALGWVGILAGKTLVQSLPAVTLILIAVGGLIYSAGVPFYLWERLKFQNAIWHGFVVAAAACHFIGIAALYL